MQLPRIVLGTTLAPLTLPMSYMALALVFSRYAFGAPGHLENFFLGVLSIAGVSYAASCALGLPLVIYLRLTQRLTLLWCISLSTLMGSAAVTIYVWWGGGSDHWFMAMLGALAGFLVSSAFCLIAGVPFRDLARGALAKRALPGD
jgi:hypothetical protein